MPKKFKKTSLQVANFTSNSQGGWETNRTENLETLISEMINYS